MKKLPFTLSSEHSIGTELEIQIIDPMTYDLIARAKDLIRNIKNHPLESRIKPEITQSMIEINSAIHTSSEKLYAELLEIRYFLLEQAKKIGICFSGGGTHPFQKWSMRKIFPSLRFKNKSHQYQYLSKRSTVFGQHVHIGCKNAEDALYLTHALARYIPQLIAINASSPFYQGVDTGFQSSRSNDFNSFPTSGVIPYYTNWMDFSAYYYKMRKLGIVSNMKDFYWDIRPKPEFGTVEVRVCDTPLSIKSAAILVAYVQSLSAYLLHERPLAIHQDLYLIYNYNRFQASRYGFEGEFINPFTFEKCSIEEDILNTIKTISHYVDDLKNNDFVTQLHNNVINKLNDAVLLRQIQKRVETLPKLMHEQCIIWAAE
jgi:carboxylate-amine ligase